MNKATQKQQDDKLTVEEKLVGNRDAFKRNADTAKIGAIIFRVTNFMPQSNEIAELYEEIANRWEKMAMICGYELAKISRKR